MSVTKALRRLGVACGLLSLAPFAHAEFLGAKTESIASGVLHENRAIEVYLPEESSKQPAQRFETLYVLDGDWNARLVIEVVNFTRQLGMMPPVILVSVPNYFDPHGVNSRDRDLTPPGGSEEPRAGGAAEFLAFLKNELIPFVDQHYPTNGVHLIHGHSYGGLFLMYVLEHEPQLFDGYLILDPAMWWDHNAFKATLHERLAAIPSRGKAIYIAGRAGAGAKDMGLDDLEPILQASLPASLHWRMRLYESETHDSLKLKATYDALRFAYGGYTQDTVEVAPADGIMLKGHPVRVGVSGRPFDIHYTTDGSEPTEKSPPFDGSLITVSDPGKTRLKLISTRGIFDREIPLNLKFGAPLSPAPGLEPAGSAGDWRYSLYPQEAWPSLGTKRIGKPVREGTAVKELSLKDLGRDRVAGRLTRNLSVPADGYFIFALRASQSRLRLGDTTLISDPGPDDQRMRSFIAPLRQGTYLMSVDFVTTTENPSLEVAVFRYADDQLQWWDQRPLVELGSR
jgi:predicted alpha/beta superfamily hydrolase